MFRDLRNKIYAAGAFLKQTDLYQYEFGFSQWKGTRQIQNDVIGVAGPEPRKGILLSLADGVGESAIAGTAAKTAVSAVLTDYRQNQPEQEMRAQVLRMLGSAQRSVMALNNARAQESESAKATIACLLARNGRMCAGSIGNVRIFLVRCGRMLQLNRDHLQSLELEQRDILNGLSPNLEPITALSVTSYIGKEGLKELDFLQEDLRLQPDDYLILMSSGLYGILTEEEMIQTIAGRSPQTAADGVIEQVYARSSDSQSNASIAILRIGISRTAEKRFQG